MITINDDKQLRQHIDSLDLEKQRKLAVILVNNVFHLNKDERLNKLLIIAQDSSANDDEKQQAYQQTKTIMVNSYTNCGTEADWEKQAEHFVAGALMVCLTPEKLLSKGKSLAWKAAMESRMAKNCEMIEKDTGEVDNEALKQYKLSSDFINTNS